MFRIFILFFLNLFISWSNAYGSGRNMRVAKLAGGFPWLLNWCGIIMAGCGFTWCYTIVLVGIGYAVGELTLDQVDLGLKAGYVIIIPAVLSTGFVITVHSWIRFFQKPTLGGGLTTAWNTYAQVSNTMNAVEFFPKAVGDLLGSLKKDDEAEKNEAQAKLALLTIILVIMALLMGVLTTRYIVLSAAEGTTGRECLVED